MRKKSWVVYSEARALVTWHFSLLCMITENS